MMKMRCGRNTREHKGAQKVKVNYVWKETKVRCKRGMINIV